MDAKIKTFCESSFSKHEKRALLFPVKPRLCHTCQKPKAKKHINFDNFSNYHQRLICMCVLARHPAGQGGGARRDHDDAVPGGDNDAVPGGHDGAAPGGHDGAAPGGHDGPAPGGHGGPVPGGHGGPAPGGHGGPAPGGHGGGRGRGHNNCVTIAQFTAFQIQITNSINQITNNINQITNNINQINNNINNILNRLNNNNII